MEMQPSGLSTGEPSLPSVQEQNPRLKREGQRLTKRWGVLDTDAINFKNHWQRCYEYIVPRKDDVIATRMPGDDRESDLFDTTAILANEQLGAALHSMLTNPEVRFFEISFGDPALDEDPAVKQWCRDVGDRIFRVLNRSNFQTEIFEIYVDIGAIGTACLYMEENEEFTVQFSARALKEIRVDEDATGLIDTVFRVFKLTAHQIVQMWPNGNIPAEIKKLADENDNTKFDILHAVEPLHYLSDQQLSMKLKMKKQKYSSQYVLKNHDFIIHQSGYREFPYAVPRWSKTTGEKYGRGPGMQMLPDIQMVNAMMLTLIQGAQKTVDPPLMVADDSVIGQVSLTPGGLTVVRPGALNDMPIKPLITNAQVELGDKMVEAVRQRIRAGFYIDQLQLPKESPQRTAEEVRQIAEEQMRLLGPVLGRQHFELLRPMIARVFDIMVHRDEIPAAPEKIQGKEFEVRYSSMIARAQRLNEAQDIVRALQIFGQIAQVDPSIKDVTKTDEIGRELWDIFGNNPKLLRDKQELDKIRAQQAKAAQEAKARMDQAHQAEQAKNVAPLIDSMANARQAQQAGALGQQ